jgi:hypothetical protein
MVSGSLKFPACVGAAWRDAQFEEITGRAVAMPADWQSAKQQTKLSALHRKERQGAFV